MEHLDETQIIQMIATESVSVVHGSWSEIMIKYYVDDDQSDFGSSYLISENGMIKEKPLPFVDSYDRLFRQLREVQKIKSGQKFTSCVLRLWNDGRFDAAYGYGDVDWDDLINQSWNFPDAEH